jgi:hypothetical protein
METQQMLQRYSCFSALVSAQAAEVAAMQKLLLVQEI